MERDATFDLQAMQIEFKNGQPPENFEAEVETLAALYMRAMEELGLLRKTKRKPTRVYNAPRCKSILGVQYGK